MAVINRFQSFTIATLSGCFLLLSSPSDAQTISGQVLSIGDGDTIRVSANGKPLTVRLACIDAPETAQTPYGVASRQRLQQLLPAGQTVSLEVVDTDRYGRTVAKVYKGSISVNLVMVQEGQAVVYSQYLSGCPELKNALLKAESSAKGRRLAFWNQANPVMPWDYRHGKSKAGTPSPSLSPKPKGEAPSSSTGLPPCTKSDCNCSDFSSQAEAQRVLQAFPGDRFGLDRDKDGVACESLR